MTASSFDLSAMVWLVAAQFLLYALGWALSGVMLREQRTAAAHWGAFMLLIGTGFVLTSQRAEPRTWWPYCGSTLAFIGGYVALHRGIEFFLGQPRREREHLATLALLLVAVFALGPQAEHAPARVLLTYAGGGWVLGRTLWTTQAGLRDEFGPRTTCMMALPALLMIVLFAVRGGQQLLNWGQALEMHQLNHTNRDMLYGYLVGAALFNFSFMGLLTTRLVGRLREQSRHDPLTGLPNRRALEHDLQREWQRLHRGGRGFAVLALDLDHFKKVNDQHGHGAGDTALAQSALRLRQAARSVDTLARTGGEEFIVLMPQTDAVGAQAAAERLRHSINREPLALDEATVRLTVSIGVALASKHDTELNQVLLRADRALYRAKEEGRDRVVMALTARA